MNTIALAWGDGILLNWTTATTTTNENHFWIFNMKKPKMHIDSIRHSWNYCAWEEDRKYEKNAVCANCEFIRKNVSALFGSVAYCCCRRVYFFCVTLPLIDHIFTFSEILPHFAVSIQCCVVSRWAAWIRCSATFIQFLEDKTKQKTTKKNAILKMTTTAKTTNR